mgnify:FL=1|jgi:Zn-dependent protease|tara:strand:+ start:1625 stop:2227 length:603 start_codon:yes stop_codon:yes gene_type:complete
MKMKFTLKEFKDLGISALVIGFVFAWIMRDASIFGRTNFLFIFAIMLVAVGTAFIFHELSHKAIAQRFGCWAEYRIWKTGLIIAFFLAIVGGFVFAAPGAVYIKAPTKWGLEPGITKRQNGLISAAGPIANLVLAFIFLLLTFGNGIIEVLGWIGFRINVFIALFNLLPFPPLDGSKVIEWDKKLWGLLILTTALLYARM